MHFLLKTAMLSAMALGSAAAQDRVSELDDDVNTAGFTRRSMPLRIGAEVGMGLLGEALTLGGGLVSDATVGGYSAAVVAALGGPALIAGGVYLGGRWTGGRGGLGWTLLGAYGGLLPLFGAVVVTNPYTDGWPIFAEILTIPLLSTILAYELSDRSATNKLKDKRKKLKQAEEPLMFQFLAMPF